VKDYQNSDQKELVTKLIQYVDNEIDKYWDVKEKISGIIGRLISGYPKLLGKTISFKR
jgi:transcription elongation factor GreA-like protein